MMRIFGEESEWQRVFPLLEIQHPNFIDLYEAYLFRSKIFAIIEYIGFLAENLL